MFINCSFVYRMSHMQQLMQQLNEKKCVPVQSTHFFHLEPQGSKLWLFFILSVTYFRRLFDVYHKERFCQARRTMNCVCVALPRRLIIVDFFFLLCADEVAEWLRRWTANPLCSARVGSNPILVVIFLFLL